MLMPLIAPHIILILGSFIIGGPESALVVTGTHEERNRTFFVFYSVLVELAKVLRAPLLKGAVREGPRRSQVRIRIKNLKAVRIL